MSKTTYIVLLVLGVIGVFVAFMFFSGRAQAQEQGYLPNVPKPNPSNPFTGTQNGTAPAGANTTNSEGKWDKTIETTSTVGKWILPLWYYGNTWSWNKAKDWVKGWF